MDRKALLESKKARLEELKRQRVEREREFQQEVKSSSISTTSAIVESSNDLVNSIVKDVLKTGDKSSDNRAPIENKENESAADLNVKSIPQGHRALGNPSVMMYSKAVDVETDNELLSEPEKNNESNSFGKSIAEIKASIESELQARYAKELDSRLKDIVLDQEKKQREANQAIFKIFESPKDPNTENTEKKSRYAKHLAQETTSGSLSNSEFSATSSSLVTDITTFDSGTKHKKSITSLDWSPHYPELLLASYSSPENMTSTGPRGVIIIWNLQTKKPEFTLLSYAELTMAQFCKKQSNQVVAGGKDGKLYLWQFDSSSRYPIISSSTASFGQSISPVTGIHETSNSFVSITAKGLISIYSLSLVNKISEETIRIPDHPSYLLTSCYIDSIQLVLGLSTGEVYLGRQQKLDELQLLYSTSKNARLPITCLDCVNGTVLAGSIDYKLKILNVEKESRQMFVPYLVADCKFDSDSTRFISISFDGKIDFWDTKQKKIDPVESIQLKNDVMLNRARRSLDRKYLACGALDGQVYVIKYNI
ncbi:hypothetical protein FOA43_004325 [Brettanomyces nanus]|uniref:Uncharacterized protein n=1 Tax=Eeniella nana TaxID=13502 RepID=A0A875S5N1_EENNA|nr:uncharacterized protein FOA43_004325 [Brettanomyces nanus]QPG76931.1 hypothetical protein FOA43_004325 [Brettanomyces nanus]